MKKIKLILFVCTLLFCLSASSQVPFKGTTSNPTAAISNSSSDTLNLTMSGQYNKVMTIHVLATKSSGTMAGTVRLYGSNYNNVAGAWTPVSDTLTLQNNATNQKVWTLTEPAFKYYQIIQSGATTVAGLLQAVAMAIKP